MFLRFARQIRSGQSGSGGAAGLSESDPGTTSCHGDGSVAGCPCGNASATTGEGCAHSLGNGMRIRGRGTASLSSGDLTLVVEGMPLENTGFFVAGTSLAAAPSFGYGGLLCVGGEVRRFEAAFRPGASLTDASCLDADRESFFAPGGTHTFQYFTRDLRGTSPCGGAGNFSPAYTVTLAP